MTLFQWILVSTLASVPATASIDRTAEVAPRQETTPRVEIGEAVLTIYDASGKPTVVK